MKIGYIKQAQPIATTSHKNPEKNFTKDFFESVALRLNFSAYSCCKNEKSALKDIKGSTSHFIYRVHSKDKAKNSKNLHLVSQNIEKLFYTNALGKLVVFKNPEYKPTK